MKISPEIEQTLPNDEFSERAILGAMLINNKYVNEVFSRIDSDDFYKDSHKKIAAALKNLTEKGSAADTVTVSGLLKKKKELDFVGGYEYLNSLLDGIPENLNIGEYIQTVLDLSSLRKLIMTSMGVIQKGVDHRADTNVILSELQEDIIKISKDRDKDGFIPSSELIQDTLTQIENIQKHGDKGGLKTGYYDLDNMTAGFHKGDLVVIAARPSMGKTALALNMAARMAIREEKAVGFFSIEMSRYQIMMRLIALTSNINMGSIRTGKPRFSQKEWNRLELDSNALQNAKLFIDDSASLSIIEMKTRARRLMNEYGLDIIFVDYLQLVKVGGETMRRNDSRAQEVATISASLKELAKELQIPVVALAQLNRSPEQRGVQSEKGLKYQLSDLKESGAIEQDADLVMFLHRDEQVNRDTERKGEADLIVAKQRNGPTGKITLAFIDKSTRFENFEFGEKEFAQ